MWKQPFFTLLVELSEDINNPPTKNNNWSACGCFTGTNILSHHCVSYLAFSAHHVLASGFIRRESQIIILSIRWCAPTRPCPTPWASWRSSTASTPTSSWQTTAPRGSTAPRSSCGVSWRSTSPSRRSTHVSAVGRVGSVVQHLPRCRTYLLQIRGCLRPHTVIKPEWNCNPNFIKGTTRLIGFRLSFFNSWSKAEITVTLHAGHFLADTTPVWSRCDRAQWPCVTSPLGLVRLYEKRRLSGSCMGSSHHTGLFTPVSSKGVATCQSSRFQGSHDHLCFGALCVHKVHLRECVHIRPFCVSLLHGALVALHSFGFQFPYYSFAENQMDLHEYKCIPASSSPRSFSRARTNRLRRAHEPRWYPLNAILNCLSEHCLESVRAGKQPESGECCFQP